MTFWIHSEQNECEHGNSVTHDFPSASKQIGQSSREETGIFSEGETNFLLKIGAPISSPTAPRRPWFFSTRASNTTHTLPRPRAISKSTTAADDDHVPSSCEVGPTPSLFEVFDGELALQHLDFDGDLKRMHNPPRTFAVPSVIE